MGFVMPHITILIAAGAVALALLLQIVGLATTGWYSGLVATFGGLADADFGLFKFCVGSNCADYPITSDSLNACRAFGILGVLAMAASLAFALLICLMSEKKQIFSLGAIGAAAAGAFCALIEFAVFAGEVASSGYGYSFALTIVACVLCVLAAVLFFIGRSRTE